VPKIELVYALLQPWKTVQIMDTSSFIKVTNLSLEITEVNECKLIIITKHAVIQNGKNTIHNCKRKQTNKNEPFKPYFNATIWPKLEMKGRS